MGETLILLPVSKFSKKELQNRLRQMKTFFDENCNKQSLINLYESNLKYDQKKFAILTKLRMGTQRMKSKSEMSQCQPLNNILNNNFKGKIIATQIVEPFQIKEQIINISRPLNEKKRI